MESNKKAEAYIRLRQLFTLENDEERNYKRAQRRRIWDRWRAFQRMNTILENNKGMKIQEDKLVNQQ